jgi:poly-gamma-glutamate synthesis protein (capsule biosynthesis protein)
MADAPDIASTPGAGALVMDDVRGDAHAPAHAEVDPRVPRFAAACTAGERVRLHAVGDVLLHQELQRTAYADDRGARALWVEVEDLLADAELTIANLESPLAPGLTRDGREAEDPGRRYDSVVYTAYPSFNVHPLLARGLVESGVDLVTTANNHALDRGPEGIDRTIRELRRAKLPFVGTRTQADAQRDRTGTWSAIATAGPLRVGVVACTEWVNQRPDPQHQVLRCRSDRAWIEREVKRLRARDDVDVVVVAPHWGKEYAAGPAEWQRSWAQRMIDAGASLVLGGHPHVLQPWERLAARDGREAGVVWSLGNFASHQQDLPKRSEAIVQVGLVRDAGGATHVAAFAAHPIHQARDGERFTVRSIVRDQGPHDAWDHVRGVLGRAGELTPGSAWWDLAVCDDTASAP